MLPMDGSGLIMSFFSKLFGGGVSEKSGDDTIEAVVYEGYRIRSIKMQEGGQYRVCAEISRELNGEEKTHKLIRADMCSSAEDASEIAMRKAKQMIKEQGDRLFG